MRIAPILAVLALAAAGCSSSTPKPAAAPAPAVIDSTAPAPASSTPAPAAAARLKLGTAATLTTPSGPLEVTVLKVVDPAKPKESYIYPTAGEHWVGIQFRFVNKGTKPIIDSPMAGLEASDAQDQRQGSFPDQDIAAGPMIDPIYGLHLQPGDTTVGYIVYGVSDGTKLVRIRYTPAGGSSAQWSLS